MAHSQDETSQGEKYQGENSDSKSCHNESADIGGIEQQAFDILIDTSGLFCPEPVMILHSAVRKLAAGKIVKVVATDPSTARDIPKFCRFLGHELICQEELADNFFYFIRRA